VEKEQIKVPESEDQQEEIKQDVMHPKEEME